MNTSIKVLHTNILITLIKNKKLLRSKNINERVCIGLIIQYAMEDDKMKKLIILLNNGIFTIH